MKTFNVYSYSFSVQTQARRTQRDSKPFDSMGVRKKFCTIGRHRTFRYDRTRGGAGRYRTCKALDGRNSESRVWKKAKRVVDLLTEQATLDRGGRMRVLILGQNVKG